MPTIILMTKTPLPGRVKTRLSPFLAPEEAAFAAAAFLRDLAATLARFVNYDFRFAIPDGENPDIVAEMLGKAWQPVFQGPGSLGERLARVMDAAYRDGPGPVLVIGSDHPNLPADLIGGCLDAAEHGRIGWIPTEDGGFAALASPEPCPELFADVPWSTPGVAEAVRLRAAESGRELVPAGRWYDVDTAADLLRLAADIRRNGTCAHTGRFLLTLTPPLDQRTPAAGAER